MRLAIFGLFLLFFNALCIAGTIDKDNSDKEYLDYGSKHECVLKLVGHMADPLNRAYSGSCVIIDPYHVVTAAHVVAQGLSHMVIHNGKAYYAHVVVIHSEWEAGVMDKNDIAVIRLMSPIKLDFYPKLYKKNDELKKVCSISGYGYSGTLSSGYDRNKFDNKKRAGSNIVSRSRGNLLVCSSTDNATSLEFLITPGDSGGGLFIDNKLAGINSCVFSTDGDADSDYGDESGHTRISDYADWIEHAQINIEKLINSD